MLIDNKLRIQHYEIFHELEPEPEERNLSSLNFREFFDTAALLIRRGDAATRGYTESLLHEGATKHAKAFATGKSLDIWQSFVSLLLDNYIHHNSNRDQNHHPERWQDSGGTADTDMGINIVPDVEPGTKTSSDSRPEVDIDVDVAKGLNEMLGRIIRDTGLSASMLGPPRVSSLLGPPGIVIDELPRRPGVAINARFFDSDRTILHELCAAYLELEVSHQRSCVKGLQKDIPMRMRNDKRRFLRYLMAMGADPRLMIAGVDDAKSALDALREPGMAGLMGVEDNGGEGADFLPERSREYLRASRGPWRVTRRRPINIGIRQQRRITGSSSLISRFFGNFTHPNDLP